MRRSLVPVVVLLLSSLACQPRGATQSPGAQASDFDALVERFAALGDAPSARDCAELDGAFESLANSSDGDAARYAQAELALRCGDADSWRRHHQALADAGYVPSLGIMANDALAAREWGRAGRLLEQLDNRDEPALREQLQRIQAQLLHARWVDRGAPKDFEALEQGHKRAIVEDARDLDARADLIRLYVEQAALTGDPRPLLLARVTEEAARRVAAELDSSSPRLELVSGFLLELGGDRAAAVQAWSRALELNAGLVEPRLWLGLAAIDRRDFEQAQDQLQRYVKVYPEHVGALLALGVAARGAGDLDAAADLHEQVIALAPDDPRPAWNVIELQDLRLRHASSREAQYELLDSYAAALRRFERSYTQADGRRCRERGAAGVAPDCLRDQAALADAAAQVPGRLTQVMLVKSWLAPTIMPGPASPEEWPPKGELERLLELEREAVRVQDIRSGVIDDEAGVVMPPRPEVDLFRVTR